MEDLSKEHSISEYKTTLLKSFPKALRSEVEIVLNILPLDINNVKLVDGRIHNVENLIHSNFTEVLIENELLSIPSRVYFNEPEKQLEAKLSKIQKTILNCIYLTHHNGYLRQHRLENLSDSNEYWILPFKFQLLNEYVIEILDVLEEQIKDENINNYLRFINENQNYWQKVQSRIASYWNEYYRRNSPRIKNYVGRKIEKKIKKANA